MPSGTDLRMRRMAGKQNAGERIGTRRSSKRRWSWLCRCSETKENTEHAPVEKVGQGCLRFLILHRLSRRNGLFPSTTLQVVAPAPAPSRAPEEQKEAHGDVLGCRALYLCSDPRSHLSSLFEATCCNCFQPARLLQPRSPRQRQRASPT